MSTTTTMLATPSEAVAQVETSAEIKAKDEVPNIREIREAIPKHLFKPSIPKTLYYLGRDISLYIGLLFTAWYCIPLVPSAPLRWALWITYGFWQGLVYTGLWQIGHEMGHWSLLPSKLACDVLGFLLHSFCLTPFFSWRFTHKKHHIYTVHMLKDPNHIPDRLNEDDPDLVAGELHPRFYDQVGEWIEDAPAFLLFKLVILEIIGWPFHLAFSVSCGKTSCDYRHSASETWMPNWLRRSHYNPIGSNFRRHESGLVILSDIGVSITCYLCYKFATTYGWGLAFLLFVQPWMWLNHWVIAVTFLQHTHVDVPKYEPEAWTWTKGALATIDRDFGFIGTFFFHNVLPFHVIHHISTKIPFYNAPEATEYIKPVLGDAYHRDDSPYIWSYWRDYTLCRWVAPDRAEKTKDRALWFVDGNGKPLSKKAPTAHAVPLRKTPATPTPKK